MHHSAVLDDLRVRGYVASVNGDRLKLRGPCRPPAELEQRLRECRDELVRLLREEESKVGTGAEVFELARKRFPNRDDLPAPPPVPGRDPLAKRSTDKARFFRGDWRRAWPQDFDPGDICEW